MSESRTPSALEADMFDFYVVEDEGDEEPGMTPEEIQEFLSQPVEPPEE